MLMGMSAVARNLVQLRTDYVRNTGRLFYLPAVVGDRYIATRVGCRQSRHMLVRLKS